MNNAGVKRVMDIIVAGVGLLVCAPVFLAIAVWIRADSPGPVLFRQKRIGQYGKPFNIVKFRTMLDGTAGSMQITATNDSRITKAGHWLRQTKLDELPQLLNVLLGQMSLVGPRPEVPKYVATYPPAIRQLVLSVRPGLTDEASIEFRNEGEILASAADPEEAYTREILPRKLALHVRYARNNSICGDARIIVRTCVAVLRNGARDAM